MIVVVTTEAWISHRAVRDGKEIAGACLKNDLFRGLVSLQEVADIEKSMVLVAGLLPLQVVPPKLDQLLAVCRHAAWQVAHHQCCQLQQLHVDCI